MEPWWPTEAPTDAERPTRIAFCLDEERGALRLFLRAIRRLKPADDWEAAVWTADPREVRVSQKLRQRLRVVGPGDTAPEALIAGADLLVAASGGPRLAPDLVRQALASATVPVCSQLPLYNELTRDGELGLLFQAGDAITLAGQIERLLASPALRRELVAKGRGAVRDWEAVTDQVEAIYERICARRHDPRGNPEVRRRVARRRRGPRRPAHAHRPLARTARRRSRRCSPPPARRASGRSRSPTTTRSRAPSPRRRSPTTSASR